MEGGNGFENFNDADQRAQNDQEILGQIAGAEQDWDILSEESGMEDLGEGFDGAENELAENGVENSEDGGENGAEDGEEEIENAEDEVEREWTNADLKGELDKLDAEIAEKEDVVARHAGGNMVSKRIAREAQGELEKLREQREALAEAVRESMKESAVEFLRANNPAFNEEVAELERQIAEKEEFMEGVNWGNMAARNRFYEARNEKEALEEQLNSYINNSVAPLVGELAPANNNEETVLALEEETEDLEDERRERMQNEYIEQQLGNGVLEGVAVDMNVDNGELENIARQMAMDQLDFEKRQRAQEMTEAAGLKKLGLGIRNAVLNSGMVRALRFKNIRKETLEHIRETGSIYAQERDGESNYDREAGMTMGDANVIARFKQSIMSGDTENLNVGDRFKGMNEEGSEKLRQRLVDLVDAIENGDEGAWQAYQEWVENARANGRFAGSEGENEGISADNIMLMGQRVRNIAENLRSSENGLEKIREYIDENVILFSAEARPGINTRTNLDEMASLALKGGVIGVAGLALARRTANSTAAKLGSMGLFAGVAGAFGAAKGNFDAGATMSQVDRAQALGRDDSKLGTGFIAKLNKKNLSQYEMTDSVEDILNGESGIRRFMTQDEEGNWVLNEGVDYAEMADYIGMLRAELNVGSEHNIDYITYNVGEDGNLEDIEAQRNQLTWAIAEGARALRVASDEENNYSEMITQAQDAWTQSLESEIENINFDRKLYRAKVIVETGMASAAIGASARAVKNFAIPWLQENHPEALPGFLRGQASDAAQNRAQSGLAGVVGTARERLGITEEQGDRSNLFEGQNVGEGDEFTVTEGAVGAESYYSGQQVTNILNAQSASGDYTGNSLNLEANGGAEFGGEGEISTGDNLGGPVLQANENGTYNLLGDVDGDGEFAKLDGVGDITYDNAGRMTRNSMQRIMRAMNFDNYSIQRIDADEAAGNLAGGGNVLNLESRTLGVSTANFSPARVEGNDYVINVWNRGDNEANLDGMKYFIQPNQGNTNEVLSFDVQNGEVRIPRDSVAGQMFSGAGDNVRFNGASEGLMEIDDNANAVVRASVTGRNTVGEVNLSAIANPTEGTTTGETTYDYVFRNSETGQSLRIDSPERTFTAARDMSAFNSTHYRMNGLSRVVRMEDGAVELGNGGELHPVNSIGGHSINTDAVYASAQEKVGQNVHFESPSLGRGLVENDVITPENMGSVDATEVAERQLGNIASSARQSEILRVMMGEEKDVTSMSVLNEAGKALEADDMRFDQFNNGTIAQMMDKVRDGEFTPKLEKVEGAARATTYVRQLGNGEQEFVSAPRIGNKATDVMLVFEDKDGKNMFEDTPELRKLLNVPEGARIRQIGWLPKCGQAGVTYDMPAGSRGTTLIDEDTIRIESNPDPNIEEDVWKDDFSRPEEEVTTDDTEEPITRERVRRNREREEVITTTRERERETVDTPVEQRETVDTPEENREVPVTNEETPPVPPQEETPPEEPVEPAPDPGPGPEPEPGPGPGPEPEPEQPTEPEEGLAPKDPTATPFEDDGSGSPDTVQDGTPTATPQEGNEDATYNRESGRFEPNEPREPQQVEPSNVQTVEATDGSGQTVGEVIDNANQEHAGDMNGTLADTNEAGQAAQDAANAAEITDSGKDNMTDDEVAKDFAERYGGRSGNRDNMRTDSRGGEAYEESATFEQKAPLLGNDSSSSSSSDSYSSSDSSSSSSDSYSSSDSSSSSDYSSNDYSSNDSGGGGETVDSGNVSGEF